MSRICQLILICLLCCSPHAFAQTDTTQDIQTALESNAVTPLESLPSGASDTNWQLFVPPALALPAKATGTASGALVAVKPAPVKLSDLAQSNQHRRFGFEFSIGGYQPSGELRNTNLIHTTVGIGFGLAIRPSASWSRLQFDAGTDLVIDGIGSPRQEEIAPGTFRGIDDVEAFVYLGPRIYLTPRDSPLKFSLGGGGTFAYYKETIQSYDDDNDGDENDTPCFSCESRKGWGAYAMAQLRYQIAPEFGIGVTAKYYRVKTEGDSFSGNLPNRTRDNWLGIMLTVSFR